MKIRSVKHNNRKRAFEVRTSGRRLSFPYSKAEPSPTPEDGVRRVYVDQELGGEGFSYELASGKTGAVHGEQVLEYNRDPAHVRDLLVYRLTIEAQRRVAKSQLSKREVIRRLGTSASQLYRLLDQANYSKSIDQLLALLQVLDCEIDLVVRAKSA